MKHEKFIIRTEDGTEGIHPSKLTADDFREMGHEPIGLRKVIKKACMDCCVGSYSEVVKCVATTCALYPYRTGKNPFAPKREYTEEERNALREKMRNLRPWEQRQQIDSDQEESA
ncbi:hypothetical protein [Caudoviricetes sp.]|nr:hypothetical protein [Caudoviricetes sp.]